MDLATFKAQVDGWMRCEGYNAMEILSHTSAVAVLGELSVGGSLMRRVQQENATRKQLIAMMKNISI